MDIEHLSEVVTSDQLHIANRLAAARSMGASLEANDLSVLMRLASDASLPREVLREIGRSAARVALATAATDLVDDHWLSAFVSEAFDGYDVEVAIARWEAGAHLA